MDPGSRSLGSDPGIRCRDPRPCLVSSIQLHSNYTRPKSTSFFSGPAYVSELCFCFNKIQLQQDPSRNSASQQSMNSTPNPPEGSHIPQLAQTTTVSRNTHPSGTAIPGSSSCHHHQHCRQALAACTRRRARGLWCRPPDDGPEARMCRWRPICPGHVPRLGPAEEVTTVTKITKVRVGWGEDGPETLGEFVWDPYTHPAYAVMF